MWLTQTYLMAPANNFPAYGYFLFNPYNGWNSSIIQSIRNGLRVLGRLTHNNLSIMMPDEDIDRLKIGEELNTRFQPLVKTLNKDDMLCGIFISNIPLEKMNDDGSNARWVYYGFDEFIKSGQIDQKLTKLMIGLAACANEQSTDDIISRFVTAFGTVSESRFSKILNTLSLSASHSGLSVGLKPAEMINILKSKNSVITNID